MIDHSAEGVGGSGDVYEWPPGGPEHLLAAPVHQVLALAPGRQGGVHLHPGVRVGVWCEVWCEA